MGGKFGVGIGRGESRNNVYFARPSAGAWHHYAFVFDTTAPAAQQIIPYVDGKPISYEKLNTGIGAGKFANSTLYFMSRAASALFGKGSLDEVAIYSRALTGTEDRRPLPGQPHQQIAAGLLHGLAQPGRDQHPGQLRRLGLLGPRRHDRQIRMGPRRQRQLRDEHGLDARPRPAPTRPTEPVRSACGSPTTAAPWKPRRARLVVQQNSPQASFTATPNPVAANAQVNFDGSASSDPDGTIVKYEWDLDGNGSYETNTGSTATTTSSYPSAGEYQVGLRVTDNSGATATTTRTVTVGGAYSAAIGSTPGLIDYWRLGEKSGTTFADIAGPSPATLKGGVTLGAPGALEADPNTAASLRRRQRRRQRRRRPLRHLAADGRILAQLGRLRQ